MKQLLLTLLLLFPAFVYAQSSTEGTVTGILSDRETKAPLDRANVVLISNADSSVVSRTMTDKKGVFTFERVRPGSYGVVCTFIGRRTFRSAQFAINAGHPRVDLGPIALAESPLALDEVAVTSQRSLFNQTIDRKVYNIDKDVMAKSSTVSDLLQNIPSVQVDVDGNVSLRGSADVMILMNGKESPLMSQNRGDVLQQLPASDIEKIEVITNPSARFTPEGTSGIINIVTKKEAKGGLNGNVTGHIGDVGRHNESLDFNYNPGGVNVFGSYTFRNDQRTRWGTDSRILTTGTYLDESSTTMRPQVHIARLGMSLHPGAGNVIELSGEYFHRRPTRDGLSTILSWDVNALTIQDYDQLETGYERESEGGATAAFQHNWKGEDHSLRVEGNFAREPQLESTRFTNSFRAPAVPSQLSAILVNDSENQGHLSVDYTNPIRHGSKLEAGYALDDERESTHSDADVFDAGQQQFVPDPTRTYQFRVDQTVHAAYATYGQTIGRWSTLAGLRGEHATVIPDLVSSGDRTTHRYYGLYPTLHLAYALDENDQIQLSYSRRIHRPRGDELNPFPEYSDPYNMEAGNPNLKPESVHSIELGYQWRNGRYSFVPSLYYRYKQDGFTRVTEAINDSTFLRTEMNLAHDRSAGLEPVVTATIGDLVNANLNANVFYEQIDASNLGYTGKKSVVSWSGTCNVNVTPGRSTMLQLNSNYRSTRLTPQGNYRPSFGLNVGVRQDVFEENISLTLAISDLLKTQRQESELDVGGTHQHVVTRRDSQIFYLGVTYHFGRPQKNGKGKEKGIQYEEPQM